MAPSTPLLEIESVGRRFGYILAVSDVSFTVCQNEVLALIGSNGAGKSTLVNLISGLDQGGTGRVWFKGSNVSRLGAHLRSRAGMGRTFQLVKLIQGLSVLQNVMSGSYSVRRRTDIGRSTASDEEDTAERASQVLNFVGLGHIDFRLDCETLTYGQQRLVEIARALASEPDLLLLDEPAAGLNTSEVLALANLIRQIQANGTTILLIEHNMRLVATVSDRCFVLHLGKRLAEGTFAEVSQDAAVRKAYLGLGRDDA